MSDHARQLVQMPRDIAAEQHVLGSMMLVPECILSVAAVVSESDFFRKDHQLIYRALLTLTERKTVIDPLTVSEWFAVNGLSNMIDDDDPDPRRRAEQPDDRGKRGDRYILQLANETYSAANAVAYAEIVREKADLRRLFDYGHQLQQRALAPKGLTSRDISGSIATALLQMAGASRNTGPQVIEEIVGDWYQDYRERFDAESLPGQLTPWPEFNRLTDGIQDSDLIVLAGRPSMGKTSVAMNLALCMANSPDPNKDRRDGQVLIMSKEMKKKALVSMALAILSDDLTRGWLRRPTSESDQWKAVVPTAFGIDGQVVGLAQMPITIDDTPGQTIQQIVMTAKREHLRRPLRAIVIDHLQKIKLTGRGRTDMEVGDITNALADLAKELCCPIILLSQLNRGLEQRPDKRPMMSDLRESGSIEQDADVIVFVYRDDYYARKERRPSEYPGVCELDIAKQRGGVTGTVYTRFNAAHARAEAMEREPMPEIPQQQEAKTFKSRSKRTGGGE